MAKITVVWKEELSATENAVTEENREVKHNASLSILPILTENTWDFKRGFHPDCYVTMY